MRSYVFCGVMAAFTVSLLTALPAAPVEADDNAAEEKTPSQMRNPLPRPACTPCKPTALAKEMNCDCENMVTVSIPSIPMVDRCLNILTALCQKEDGSPAVVDDLVGALTDVTECFGELTALNLNFTDLNEMKTSKGGQRSARLLERLLGGLGKGLDMLLEGLLGLGGDGGLLGLGKEGGLLGLGTEGGLLGLGKEGALLDTSKNGVLGQIVG